MQKNLNIILITLVLFQSCGLFDSRSVEPPTVSRSTYTPPTSPGIVITNLNFAIAEKNLDNYMRCFVDSAFSVRRFKYFPDAVSQSSYPVFQTWSLYNERIYFSNLITATDPVASSNLFPDNLNVNTAIDSAIVDMDYILIFNHNRGNVPKEVKGKLRFIMGTDTRGLWSVHSWYDFINGNNDTTWSFLKANFVN